MAPRESATPHGVLALDQRTDRETVNSQTEATKEKAVPLPRRCLVCGAVIPHGSRCNACAPPHSRERRGYGYTWRQISARARTVMRECESCGTVNDLTVHHILPLSQGGTHDPANLAVLCRRCHARLHGREG